MARLGDRFTYRLTRSLRFTRGLLSKGRSYKEWQRKSRSCIECGSTNGCSSSFSAYCRTETKPRSRKLQCDYYTRKEKYSLTISAAKVVEVWVFRCSAECFEFEFWTLTYPYNKDVMTLLARVWHARSTFDLYAWLHEHNWIFMVSRVDTNYLGNKRERMKA